MPLMFLFQGSYLSLAAVVCVSCGERHDDRKNGVAQNGFMRALDDLVPVFLGDESASRGLQYLQSAVRQYGYFGCRPCLSRFKKTRDAHEQVRSLAHEFAARFDSAEIDAVVFETPTPEQPVLAPSSVTTTVNPIRAVVGVDKRGLSPQKEQRPKRPNAGDGLAERRRLDLDALAGDVMDFIMSPPHYQPAFADEVHFDLLVRAFSFFF